MAKNAVEKLIEKYGLTEIARAAGVTPPAVQVWGKRKKLPRTEYTGETKYAEKIEKFTNGEFTKEMLLKI